MNKILFPLLLLLALATHGQEQKRIAMLQTVDDGDSPVEFTDLSYLTKRLREIAGEVLQGRYGIMSEQSIIDKLGSKENAAKTCREASCLAVIGRKINADYIGQARLGRFGRNLTISVELYNSGNGLQVGTISGEAKDVYGLRDILNEKAPGLFRKMPGVPSVKTPSSNAIVGGIGDVNTGGDYELKEKLHLVRLSTDPSGAILSFNGEPDARKTPYNLELPEGNVRIIAKLDQYEKADTTILIKQNNQSINIKLNPTFGVLEVKPAYLDGIGKDEQWKLFINGKETSSWENNLSSNKYKVELSHKCYENLSFDVGINKGKREVFDISAHIKLKKGGLVLKAERNGEPISELVFINGKQSGETPFSGTVPLCANIEVGKSREKVDVVLKHNDKVTYTIKSNGFKSSTSIANAEISKTTYEPKVASTIAIFPSDGSLSTEELIVLTNEMRVAALKVLPTNAFVVLNFDYVIDRLGGPENSAKEIRKYGGSIVDLGKKAMVDYVAQASVSKLNGNIRFKIELYQVQTRRLVGILNGDARDVIELLAIVKDKIPSEVFGKIPNASSDFSALVDRRDGKKYKIVKIGDQVWMAENLNYNASGSKCYNDNEINCQIWGRLYNWNTIKSACPKGWHLPSDTEWDVLMKNINPACSPNATCAKAGKLLKATSGWNQNGNGTDAFGFSALPGGCGYSGGSFDYVGRNGHWWTASEYNSYNAYYRRMSYDDENVDYNYYDFHKSYLFSVRCVQD